MTCKCIVATQHTMKKKTDLAAVYTNHLFLTTLIVNRGRVVQAQLEAHLSITVTERMNHGRVSHGV